jgi:PadR family transcriptional regulator, regulatory protein PadR
MVFYKNLLYFNHLNNRWIAQVLNVYFALFSTMYCIVLFIILSLPHHSNTIHMEKADSTIAQMRKGVLEMCVVAAISSREAYASDILDRLKQSQLIVVEGTLYPILTRLKNEGFLSYRWEESNSGPPRKYYSITPEGTGFLSELRSGWDELVNAVSALVAVNNQEDSKETSNTIDQ